LQRQGTASVPLRHTANLCPVQGVSKRRKARLLSSFGSLAVRCRTLALRPSLKGKVAFIGIYCQRPITDVNEQNPEGHRRLDKKTGYD
jgi:hypothetical protein